MGAEAKVLTEDPLGPKGGVRRRDNLSLFALTLSL